MKEVQLRRRETKSYLPPEVSAESKRVLASIFIGGAPLKVENSDDLVAEHLGIRKEDRDFGTQVRNFWADFRINIPSEGHVLNITEFDNKAVNVKDWLTYKWAIRHKLVATSKEEMDKNSHKMFYIHDPEVESNATNKKVRIIQAAYVEFSKMRENQEKMNQMIRVIGSTDPSRLTATQKENLLNDLVNTDPNQFVAVARDKNLEMKSFIATLLTLNIISKIGNSFYHVEEKLGDDENEAVLYLNDAKNSRTLLRLKGAAEEASKSVRS